MSQADDDEWEKVREMVRNSPPPSATREVAAEQANKEKIRRTPRHRRRKRVALLILILLGLVIAGVVFFAFDRLQPRGAKSASETQAGSKSAEAVKPSAKQNATADKTTSNKPRTLAIRKGLKTVNVRTGPSATNPVAAKLVEGDKVELISESGGWVRIRFKVGGKEGEGWVKKELLEN